MASVGEQARIVGEHGGGGGAWEGLEEEEVEARVGSCGCGVVGRQGGGGTLEVRVPAGIRQERGCEGAPGRGVRSAGFCDVCSVIFRVMMHVASRSMRAPCQGADSQERDTPGQLADAQPRTLGP